MIILEKNSNITAESLYFKVLYPKSKGVVSDDSESEADDEKHPKIKPVVYIFHSYLL